MAERAKRRLSVAKLSLSVAVAALIAGFVAQDKNPQSIAYQLTGAQPHMAPGSITAKDIKPGSLLYGDFKTGQIYSEKQTSRLFEKAQIANNTFLDKTAAANTYLTKDAAGGTYLDKADAANTYVKVDEASSHFINGDGKVFTGSVQATTQSPVDLLDIPGIAGIQGNHPAKWGTRFRHHHQQQRLATRLLNANKGGHDRARWLPRCLAQ